MNVEYTQYTPHSLGERIAAHEAEGRLLFTWSCNVFSPRLLRVGLFKLVEAGVPELLEQGIIPVPEFYEAKDSILQAGVLGGRWDPVWIGGWKYVWTEGSDPYRLWDRKQLVAWVDEDQNFVYGQVVIPRDAVQSVELFTSDDWVTRGVRVMRHDAEPVIIASEESQLPLTLPGYDALDLESETMWAGAMGAEIARRLGKPYVEST